MWEFALALLLGIVVGTFTGLTPGIHINLVAATLLASLGLFSEIHFYNLEVKSSKKFINVITCYNLWKIN